MPNDNPPTSSRTIDWAELVRKAWGPEFNQPDRCYGFSNGREFNSTDGQSGGVYGVSVFSSLLLEDNMAGLGPNDLLQEGGGRIGNG